MMELNAQVFESDGAGAPLLIAHGLFGQGRNWTTLAKKFAAKRPVATVDMRNHGDSPWDAAMDYPRMAGDLLETAATLFGGPCVLLGHSMGGKSSMAAALTQPENVLALIVADIAPVAYTDHSHAPLVAAMKAVDLSAVERRSQVEEQLAHAVPDPMLRAFLLQGVAFETVDGARTARWRLNLDAIDDNMATLLSWPADLDSRRYDGHSLFIHGSNSDYVAPWTESAIRQDFPAAEFETLQGAGHWLHAEQPDAFFARIDPWLDRVAPA